MEKDIIHIAIENLAKITGIESLWQVNDPWDGKLDFTIDGHQLSYKTVWGGEPVADMLTNYLRPEKLLIYTQITQKDLIRNYGFIPDSKGDLEVLEMFWKLENERKASPILIYAELLLKGGKRNKETAEKIYNEYIEPDP